MHAGHLFESINYDDANENTSVLSCVYVEQN